MGSLKTDDIVLKKKIDDITIIGKTYALNKGIYNS